MGTHAVARSAAQAESFTAHRLRVQDDLADDLTPVEKAFLAAMRLLLDNGLTYDCDVAAKEFLEAAPTVHAVRRRAHALLRLAGERDQRHRVSQQKI